MNSNPFIRGYRELYLVRTLMISHEADSPPIWRPLHPSQARLSDEHLVRLTCLYSDEYAIVGEGPPVTAEVLFQCRNEGRVLAVVYAVEGRDFDGQAVHVGDTPSREAARELVRRTSVAAQPTTWASWLTCPCRAGCHSRPFACAIAARWV